MRFKRNPEGLDDALIRLFKQTFADSEGAEEGQVINSLLTALLAEREDTEVQVFIAEAEQELIGAVCYTPLWFEDSAFRPMLLSPMAVATSAQGKGIGQKLINFAHAALKEEGVPFVLTYGDINFYGKSGFKQIGVDSIPAPLPLSYPAGWMAVPLSLDELPKVEGKAYCVEPFNDTELW
jgi:predicted N-acetyltransferase YhbS